MGIPKNAIEVELRKKILILFKKEKITKFADKKVFLKALIFFSTFLLMYILILKFDGLLILMTAYSLLGLSTILLSINIGHEAIHNCLSDNKRLNNIGNLTFYLAGVNPLIWKVKHLNSHHKHTNIPDLDTDFQQSKIVRLDYNYPKSKFHSRQNYYIPLLYLLYTFHWTFIKDFSEYRLLYGHSKFNLKLKSIFFLILTKIFYLLIIVIIPFIVHDYNTNVIWGFTFSYLFSGAFFGLFLIPIHINDYATIHSNNLPGKIGFIEQLEATPNFSTSNKLLNFLLGGFNHHACHHLFPSISHTHYPKITPIIYEMSTENNFTFHNLTFFQLIKSHYRHLKSLAKSR